MNEHPSTQLDKVLTQKARLGIISILMVMEETDFNYLKEKLNLTDGNLSTHLSLLEREKYIRLRKIFDRKKPKTLCQITDKGRRAFGDYMNTLERIIKDIPRK
ncbi:MAG: transcriptional regulator [Candidatus Aminicenantales bacterium]